MSEALAAMVVTGILLPHVLRLQRVPPITAIVLWLNGLALRALAAVLAAIYVLYFLPRTALFVDLSHWCARMPVIGHGLHAEGHAVAADALYLPSPWWRRCSSTPSAPHARSARHAGSSGRPSAAARGTASSSEDRR
jgi:hypothetical protein